MLTWSSILLQTTEHTPKILFADDKVYTVMTVLLVIFGLIVGYLFFTNRKVKKLEEKLSELENNK